MAVVVVISFIIGLLGHVLLASSQSTRFISTEFAAMGGALLAAFIGRSFGCYRVEEPLGIAFSITGAIAFLIIFRLWCGSRGRTIGF